MPGGGPPALVTRMSTPPSSSARRPRRSRSRPPAVPTRRRPPASTSPSIAAAAVADAGGVAAADGHPHPFGGQRRARWRGPSPPDAPGDRGAAAADPQVHGRPRYPTAATVTSPWTWSSVTIGADVYACLQPDTGLGASNSGLVDRDGGHGGRHRSGTCRAPAADRPLRGGGPHAGAPAGQHPPQRRPLLGEPAVRRAAPRSSATASAPSTSSREASPAMQSSRCARPTSVGPGVRRLRRGARGTSTSTTSS